MNQRILALALVLAAAVSLPAFAADTANRETDALLPLSSNPVISAGMSREAVEFQLGGPTGKIATNLWLYTDFRAVNRPAGSQADALLVVFKNDVVSFVRLTEWAHVRVALTKLRTAGSPTVAAN